MDIHCDRHVSQGPTLHRGRSLHVGLLVLYHLLYKLSSDRRIKDVSVGMEKESTGNNNGQELGSNERGVRKADSCIVQGKGTKAKFLEHMLGTSGPAYRLSSGGLHSQLACYCAYKRDQVLSCGQRKRNCCKISRDKASSSPPPVNLRIDLGPKEGTTKLE